MMVKIRLIEAREIPILKDFAPPDWNSDLSVIFSQYFDRPYFYPIVAKQDGNIVGCAQGLLNGNTGWLGNIIVLPEFRGQGIGTALTARLIDVLKSKGCRSQLLIATAMGEPIYRRLGFERVAEYIFFKREDSPATGPIPGVRRPGPAEADRIFALDRAITGEERQPFLSNFLADAWVHEPVPGGSPDGFFLPGLGNGLILAGNNQAGLALLGFRLGLGSKMAVVPDANLTAVEFLQQHGFQETNRAPRMLLGAGVNWMPQHVYSRGSGYCG
jgi:GNAT superfamily N-acetyltransferase